MEYASPSSLERKELLELYPERKALLMFNRRLTLVGESLLLLRLRER